MPLSKDALLSALTAADIQFVAHEHPAVLTCDAQEKALAGVNGVAVKNLFLKDKKNKLYIITSLPDTKVDIKVLSARLGLGKSGLHMASENLLGEVLQVGPGSVTPLAIANVEASTVALLLDKGIRDQEVVLVHPLVNTCSIAMSPAGLDSALRLFGREPVYVDLQADPKIDKDNPPDLRDYVPTTAATPSEAAAPTPTTTPAKASAAAGPSTAVAAAAGAKKAASTSVSGAAHAKPMGQQVRAPIAVQPCCESILSKVCKVLTGQASLEHACQDPNMMAVLRADLEMELSALKSAAYAAGYMAGKGELVAVAQRHYTALK